MSQIVIFDIGSVLISDYTILYDTHFKSSSYLPVILSANKRAWEIFKVGLLTEDQFWSEIIKNSPIKDELINGGHLHTASKDEDVLKYLKKVVRENLTDYPESFAVAKKLCDLNIPLGILSNHSDEWTDYIFEKYPLFDQLYDKDIVCVSSKMKCAKPETECYQALYDTIKRKYANAKKGDVIFIDDKSANVNAANQFGLIGILHDARKEKGDALQQKLAQVGIKF